jgi:cell division septation protein DedD
MYAEGRAVARDPVLAVTLWREAAEAGYGPAQFNLAMALQDGLGVGRNEGEAQLWLERAKEQGITQAEARRQLGQDQPEIPRASGPSEVREAAPASSPTRVLRPPAGPERAPAPAPQASARSAPREAPPAPPPAPRPVAAAPPSSNGFYVQLASVRSQEGAVLLGRDLARSNPGFLADLEPTVRSVDLGDRGVWHRVLFGPLPTRERAAGICDGIRAHGRDCLVAAYP